MARVQGQLSALGDPLRVDARLDQLQEEHMAAETDCAALEVALEALQEAKAAGKIGHIGITLHSLEVFERAIELDWVETIMFPYNIVETQGMHQMLSDCLESILKQSIRNGCNCMIGWIRQKGMQQEQETFRLYSTKRTMQTFLFQCGLKISWKYTRNMIHQ